METLPSYAGILECLVLPPIERNIIRHNGGSLAILLSHICTTKEKNGI